MVSKLQGQQSKRCLTSAAFYRTRRALVETLGLDRRQVKPATPLEVILPEDTRREKWLRIQDATRLKLQNLQYTGWSVMTLLAVGVALTVGPGVFMRAGAGGLALLFFLGLVAGGFLLRISPELAVEFPHDEATVGDLARDVLALNHGRLAAEVGSWSKDEVWETLCRVIVMQTGVEREKIGPEARIVDDLGTVPRQRAVSKLAGETAERIAPDGSGESPAQAYRWSRPRSPPLPARDEGESRGRAGR